MDSEKRERLKGADRGGAHGYDLAPRFESLPEGTYKVERDFKSLPMHRVFPDFLALDGLEGSGSDMERHFEGFDAATAYLIEELGSEVEPGGRGSHASFDSAIASLIIGGVGFLRFAVQIRRDGYVAGGFYD